MSEPFIVYRPCVTFTDGEHEELLDWVRDEINTPRDDDLELSGHQTIQDFWESEGKLFLCPGNAIYSAKGNPDNKVRRCYLILTGPPRKLLGRGDCHYPPNWLDRPRTHD